LTKKGIHHLATAVDHDYRPTLGRFRRDARKNQIAIAGRGSCSGARVESTACYLETRATLDPGRRSVCRSIRQRRLQAKPQNECGGSLCSRSPAGSRHQVLPLRSKKPAPSTRCRHNVPSVRWKDCIGAKAAPRAVMQLPCLSKSSSDISGNHRVCATMDKNQKGPARAELVEFWSRKNQTGRSAARILGRSAVPMAWKRPVWHLSAPAESVDDELFRGDTGFVQN
jgi:hypothetical protein